MIKWIAISLLCIMLLAGCAASSNSYKDTPRDSGKGPAGFWSGLWHGMMVLVMFIVSLFKSSVGIYEIHNTGFWYNFGFILGIVIIYGGGSGTVSRSRRE